MVAVMVVEMIVMAVDVVLTWMWLDAGIMMGAMRVVVLVGW